MITTQLNNTYILLTGQAIQNLKINLCLKDELQNKLLDVNKNSKSP